MFVLFSLRTGPFNHNDRMFGLFNHSRNSHGLKSRRFVRFNPGPSSPNRSFVQRRLR
jgi:hypothetical protein